MKHLSTTFFAILLFLGILPMSAQNSSSSLTLTWEVGHMASLESRPDSYVSANVPGAVQQDYINAGKLPPFAIATNVEAFKAYENKFWCYKSTFAQPEIGAQQNLVFHSRGIDYEFDLLLNGKQLFHQEGMFTPVRVILDEELQAQNTLEVIIYPIPIAEGQPEGRRQAILAAKPPVSYGWDWHPRLVPVGIWDETGISLEPQAKILAADFTYKLNKDLSEAAIAYSFTSSDQARGGSYEWNLLDASGKTVLRESGQISADQSGFSAKLAKPELWWSFDHGTPYQYSSELVLKNSAGKTVDTHIRKVGFRKVELVMNAGAWDQPQGFPKSRSVAPFTLRLNNRTIFAKGSNWVHPEIFYGTITEQRYREQLLLTKELNMNLLRIWGGGITNKASFFELCDSLGIMVWQEFPLACNPYPNDPHYLEVLEQEATSLIKRVRQHPSLAMWSGGNELFNSWSGMTEQAHPLRLLNSLCYRIDPHTPYINTSPIFGVGHGHYLFYDREEGRDVFQRMHRAHNTAYTEFGMPSLAPLSTLEEIIPEAERFPPSPSPSWVIHGAFEAWKPTSWIELATIEKYFGKAQDLEELVWQSQTLQAIGYKAIFEEGRRQKPYCSMVLNWCLNEPWPTAANNSLIAYPSIKKPAFEAVKASLRPVMASAKFERFSFGAGGQLEFDLWALNDTYEPVALGEVEVFLTLDGKKTKIGSWEAPATGKNLNTQGPRIRHYLPENTGSQLAKLSVEVKGNMAYNSEYFVLIQSKRREVVDVNRLNF